MLYLGLDPGASGGYALHDGTTIIEAALWPQTAGEIDYTELANRICGMAPVLAVIERVSAMPGQGVVSMFSFGKSTGILHGIMFALRIPFELVSPQRWKKAILVDSLKDKAAAITYCMRKYPNVSLVKSERAKKPQDGIADAICMAEYAAMKHGVSA